jgi:hypothetical protein
MEITKAVMTLHGNDLKLSVPFAKVDESRRTVSGFATLDNVDQHGDIVTAEASRQAFARFRGNLREMHAPVAVGKVIDFSEEEFYDAESDKTYRGVFVSAYVSKGAQDTWEKVLDGTLSGFSIGGKVLDAETTYEKSIERNVQIIKDYQLLELSLVDSPANQFANVFAITKSDDGADMIKGIAVDVRLENILYCATDKIAVTTERDAADCAVCSNAMKNIGWVESSASDKTEKIRDAVAKDNALTKSVWTGNTTFSTGGTYFIPSSNTSSTPAYNITINGVTDPATVAAQVQKTINKTLEGGVDELSKEDNKEVATEEPADAKPVEEAAPEVTSANNEEVAPTEEAPAAEDVEKAVEVEEVNVEEVDLAKLFSEFASRIEGTVNSTKEETAALVKSLSDEVKDTVTALETKVSELETKFSALNETVEKRVDAVEGDTAFKKSADLGGSGEKIEKKESVWGGRFLGTNVQDILN